MPAQNQVISQEAQVAALPIAPSKLTNRFTKILAGSVVQKAVILLSDLTAVTVSHTLAMRIVVRVFTSLWTRKAHFSITAITSRTLR